MPENHIEITEHLSLCEALDRVLYKGAVISGSITLSVAHVDLIYLGLQIVVSSVDSLKADSEPAQVNLNLGLNGQLRVTHYAE